MGKLINKFLDGDNIPKPNVPIHGTNPDMSWHEWWLNKRTGILGLNVLDSYPDWEEHKRLAESLGLDTLSYERYNLSTEDLGKDELDKLIKNANAYTEYLGSNLPEDVYRKLHKIFPKKGKSNKSLYKNITSGVLAGTIPDAEIALYDEFKDLLNTATHERTHMLGGYKISPLEWKILGITDKFNSKIHRKPGFLRYFFSSNYDNYLDDAKEIYARLMTFRQKHNLDPTKEINQDDLNDWRKKGWTEDNLLNRYNDNFLLKLFNEVADNTIKNQNNFDFNINYTKRGGKLTKKVNKLKTIKLGNFPFWKAHGGTINLVRK